MQVDHFTLAKISCDIQKEFIEKNEAALMKWLGVDSVEAAMERIEDLRCNGLMVEIITDPPVWKSVGDSRDFKYISEWTTRFKVVSIKES